MSDFLNNWIKNDAFDGLPTSQILASGALERLIPTHFSSAAELSKRLLRFPEVKQKFSTKSSIEKSLSLMRKDWRKGTPTKRSYAIIGAVLVTVLEKEAKNAKEALQLVVSDIDRTSETTQKIFFHKTLKRALTRSFYSEVRNVSSQLEHSLEKSEISTISVALINLVPRLIEDFKKVRQYNLPLGDWIRNPIGMEKVINEQESLNATEIIKCLDKEGIEAPHLRKILNADINLVALRSSSKSQLNVQSEAEKVTTSPSDGLTLSE